MGGRAVEGTGLENRQARKGLVGSNPTPSATFYVNSLYWNGLSESAHFHAVGFPLLTGSVLVALVTTNVGITIPISDEKRLSLRLPPIVRIVPFSVIHASIPLRPNWAGSGM